MAKIRETNRMNYIIMILLSNSSLSCVLRISTCLWRAKHRLRRIYLYRGRHLGDPIVELVVIDIVLDIDFFALDLPQ